MLWCDIVLCKQKTAYELRISDWSSDGCSSDLHCSHTARCGGVWRGVSGVERAFAAAFRLDAAFRLRLYNTCSAGKSTTLHEGRCCKTPSPARRPKLRRYRSEEHTSELQSLMRISYAVLCLKKKKTNQSAK